MKKQELKPIRLFAEEIGPRQPYIPPPEEEEAQSPEQERKKYNQTPRREHRPRQPPPDVPPGRPLPFSYAPVVSIQPENIENDRFFKSDQVSGLDSDTFDQFVKQKDVTLVMFYDVSFPADKQSKWVKKQLVKAAEKTERKNIAFAAVNCTENSQLCIRQNLAAIPMYKMYTKGVNVGGIEDLLSANHTFLKNFMETCPIIQAHEKAERVCPRAFKKVNLATVKPLYAL